MLEATGAAKRQAAPFSRSRLKARPTDPEDPDYVTLAEFCDEERIPFVEHQSA